MAESDLVEKLSEEEKIIQNEIPNSESPQTETQIFNKIITDFSDFLSKRSVYEAAPENSKVLVFNSDLSFKEMIKAFINEDIYCALIYDSKKEYFSGIITISDILYLFQYIIKKTQEINITDYEQFIKDIFNRNKLLMNDEEEEKNENIIFKNKNFDILKYLTKINYNDYYEMIKKYNKIHIIYSISLDTSLLDVLKVIYKIGVHRLVVEETKKKGLNENKKKENEINLQNNTFDTKLEKEKNENINKTELEKGEKEKSDKKIKKVKTKKKVITEEENKENKEKEGEKVIKKKVKKIKKKKTENDLIDKEKEKDNEEKKEINNLQKSEKSVMEISNKDVLKLNVEEKSNNNLEVPSETQNFTGFVTYETVFDFLIYNYYSMEMKEFDLSLEELRKIPSNSSFIIPINTFSLMTEKVHSSFSKNITSKSDILPILTNDKKDIFGFLFLRDYLYFVSNCESNQDLTNEEFLNNMYEGIDSEKPLGKERIIYLEYNDITKKYKIKELLEKINGAPEKKIVLKYKEDENNLFFIISLKSIFDVIVKMNNN